MMLRRKSGRRGAESLSRFFQSVTFTGYVPILSVNSRGEILIVLLSFSGSKKFHRAYKTNLFYCPSWQAR